MNELFRYMSLRPPVKPNDINVHALAPSGAFADALTAAERDSTRVRNAAQAFLASPECVRSVAALEYGGTLQPLTDLVLAGEMASSDKMKGTVTKIVEAGIQPAVLATDQHRLENTLIAAKLASTSKACDVPLFTAFVRAYEAVRRFAADGSKVSLPSLLTTPLYKEGDQAEQAIAANQPRQVDQSLRDANERLSDIESATAVLTRSPFESVVTLPQLQHDATQRRLSGGLARLLQRQAKPAGAPVPAGVSVVAGVSTPMSWPIQRQVLAKIPNSVLKVLSTSIGDPANATLGDLAAVLQRGKLEALQARAESMGDNRLPILNVVKLGLRRFEADSIQGVPILHPFRVPQTFGKLRPVGISDLLVVRQNVTAYVGGDVAHIENILKSEHLKRETNRREKSEQTAFTETEQSQEEERDTQTTERFSLQRETSSTIDSDLSVKAGAAVTARYGTMVEVKANADFSYDTSSTESVRQASSFGKDVVTRAASKVSQRVHEARTTATSVEFFERNVHGFDNSAGESENISGVYQWVDKVLEAQVFNYGKRLLFDVMLPQPASFYIYAQQHLKAEGETLTKPADFVITPAELNELNYQTYAAAYEATGIDPPPALYKTKSKAIDSSPPTTFTTKADSLTGEEGYEAVAWGFKGFWFWTPGSEVIIVVGMQYFQGSTPFASGWTLSQETSEVPINILLSDGVVAFACNIEVTFRRTERAMDVWRQKAHAAIMTAYVAKKADYDRALASAAAGSTVQISGRNPEANQGIIRAEIRKMCLAALTRQQFDSFGAIALSGQNFPQAELDRAELQGRYVRFFEQAFEWDQLMYFFYPYFWGAKSGWPDRALLDDVDPQFGEFLRAGEARAVFSVRPGFETAVLHFLDSGVIWDGGDPPDVTSAEYVPILSEIKSSTGAPGSEVPYGDPWPVRLPTTLVRLRPDDKLPTWAKVDGQWAENAP
jgi:hypothetical protein